MVIVLDPYGPTCVSTYIWPIRATATDQLVEYLADLRFVDIIKVASSGYPTGQQGSCCNIFPAGSTFHKGVGLRWAMMCSVAQYREYQEESFPLFFDVVRDGGDLFPIVADPPH